MEQNTDCYSSNLGEKVRLRGKHIVFYTYEIKPKTEKHANLILTLLEVFKTPLKIVLSGVL